MSARRAASARRAVGYIRVSQVGGREGDSFLSPALQREKIEAWAAYRGFELVDWYTDLDRSGREGVHRPEFERLMRDAKTGRFDAVAVYRLTRFARSVKDAAGRYADLRSIGVELASVTEDIDTTSASGQFMQNILFAMAEFESQRIGEEWRNVHANRRRRGLAHVPGGVYGYWHQGAVIVDVRPEEAALVRLAYRLRADRAGYTAIRDRLEAAGYRSRNGNARPAQQTIAKILHSPLYAGLVRQPDGSLSEGQHPAIVDRELWERVQRVHPVANEQARFSRGGKRKSSLLSGLLVCSGCGYRMQLERDVKGWAAYRCQARRLSNPCTSGATITAAATEEYVVRALLLSRFAFGVSGRAADGVALAQLENEVEKLTTGLDRLTDRFVDGTLNEEEYAHQVRRTRERRSEVLTKLDELRAAQPDGELSRLVGPHGRIVAPWDQLPLEQQQRILRGFLRRIIVHPAPSQGGKTDRGIDFGQRLEFEWRHGPVLVRDLEAAFGFESNSDAVLPSRERITLEQIETRERLLSAASAKPRR